MWKRIGLLIVVAFLLGTAIADAQGETGTITGQLANLTPEGSGVGGVPLLLRAYVGHDEVGEPVSGVTDDEGRFEFSGLTLESGRVYQVEVVYQEALYYSEAVQFAEGETERGLAIDVWDATTSDENVLVQVSHVVVDVQEDGLLVREIYFFDNLGDRTYIGTKVGDQRQTLHFSLPPGASAFQSSAGLTDVTPAEDGYYDTMPLPPGGKDVVFSYQLAFPESKLTLPYVFNYYTIGFGLLVEDRGLKVSSPQLVEQEPVSLQDKGYLYLSGGEMEAGTRIQVTVSGLPVPASATFPWYLVAAGLGAAGVAVVLAYGVFKGRSSPVARAVDLRSERQKLVEELARLDEEFEAGQVAEEGYRQRRAEQKARILKLTQELQKRGESL